MNRDRIIYIVLSMIRDYAEVGPTTHIGMEHKATGLPLNLMYEVDNSGRAKFTIGLGVTNNASAYYSQKSHPTYMAAITNDYDDEFDFVAEVVDAYCSKLDKLMQDYSCHVFDVGAYDTFINSYHQLRLESPTEELAIRMFSKSTGSSTELDVILDDGNILQTTLKFINENKLVPYTPK